MNASTFNRLHEIRMENDAAGYTMAEMRPRFERITKRHSNGTAPRAVSAYQLFQTPPEIAARLVALLDLNRNMRVLEPSAGLGRILDAIKPFAWNVTAIEMAAECAGELFRQERPEVKILQRDFLTVTPDEIGLFDAVALNPPFHLRADITHIRHALTFLRPGGRLAAICLDTEHRRAAFQSLASTWQELPAGEFSKEGTRVATIMFTIQN